MDIFNYIEFRPFEEKDRDNINNRFKRCDYWDDDPEDITLVLYYKDDLIGIFKSIELVGNVGDDNLYYIYSRCAADKNIETKLDRDEGNSFLSPGRLMWIYILNHIYELNDQEKNFIVYNHAITSSYMYHIKMGMLPISKTKYDVNGIKELFIEQDDLNTAQLPDEEIRNPHTSYNSLYKETLDVFDSTYLFYVPSENIDYSNVEKILYSLPGAERLNSRRYNEKDMRNSKRQKHYKI
jgi:hypothetical protein